MATVQDRRLVREVAIDIDETIKVSLSDDEIVLRGHGVTETYGTAEEAISGLRASWWRHGR